ncbi:hypothetical protein B0H12DRAFT_1158332 [Mycena haematopus]|nr:hypothetical protein B0H12DRAFT_1158332 [Mycena haematopus]
MYESEAVKVTRLFSRRSRCGGTASSATSCLERSYARVKAVRRGCLARYFETSDRCAFRPSRKSVVNVAGKFAMSSSKSTTVSFNDTTGLFFSAENIQEEYGAEQPTSRQRLVTEPMVGVEVTMEGGPTTVKDVHDLRATVSKRSRSAEKHVPHSRSSLYGYFI